MNQRTKTIANALRCACTVRTQKCHNDCPYLMREEIKKDFPMPPDEVIDGVGYWLSCDYDRISLDAADEIEQYDKLLTDSLERIRELQAELEAARR